MNNSPLEFLAKIYGNVVKYDADGNPSVFVPFYQMKSSDLVAGLPDHIHPAFKINGEYYDRILLGKYKAGENGKTGGALVSMPNIMPIRSLGSDQMLARIKMAGAGITGMTVADYGFIKLLAQKHGWNPHGNNYYGVDYRDGTPWKVGDTITVNQKKCFEGWEYTALIAHTAVAELRPDLAPTYWEKGKHVGGISVDTSTDATYQTGYRTLNGSGPKSWYLGNDLGSMADLIGSSMETQWGYRIVDCELQILPDNNAADPDADLSSTSAAWKAILPNASNDGYTLVAPGTAGTLHWNWDATNSKIILDTRCDSLAVGNKNQTFKTLKAHATRLPYVPSIVKELGLFPTDDNDNTQGNYYVNFAAGEFFARRGGYYNYASDSGLGSVNGFRGRAYSYSSYGGRPRSL